MRRAATTTPTARREPTLCATRAAPRIARGSRRRRGRRRMPPPEHHRRRWPSWRPAALENGRNPGKGDGRSADQISTSDFKPSFSSHVRDPPQRATDCPSSSPGATWRVRCAVIFPQLPSLPVASFPAPPSHCAIVNRVSHAPSTTPSRSSVRTRAVPPSPPTPPPAPPTQAPRGEPEPEPLTSAQLCVQRRRRRRHHPKPRQRAPSASSPVDRRARVRSSSPRTGDTIGAPAGATTERRRDERPPRLALEGGAIAGLADRCVAEVTTIRMKRVALRGAVGLRVAVVDEVGVREEAGDGRMQAHAVKERDAA